MGHVVTGSRHGERRINIRCNHRKLTADVPCRLVEPWTNLLSTEYQLKKFFYSRSSIFDRSHSNDAMLDIVFPFIPVATLVPIIPKFSWLPFDGAYHCLLVNVSSQETLHQVEELEHKCIADERQCNTGRRLQLDHSAYKGHPGTVYFLQLLYILITANETIFSFHFLFLLYLYRAWYLTMYNLSFTP